MSIALSLPQLGLSVAAGGLTTLSPCVFPLLPLVLGGAMQGHRLAPLAMGVGMTGSFALIGMLLGALGPALDIDADTVRTAGASLLIAFVLVMLVPALGERFSSWMLPLATAANTASTRLDGRSLHSAMALGAVLGLVWSPCSGPLLGSALTLVASDHPPLDTLILAMPISWKGTLQQYAGRLHREHADKTHVRIVDFIDSGHPALMRMWSKRQVGYRAMGYRVETSAGDLFISDNLQGDGPALAPLPSSTTPASVHPGRSGNTSR